MTRCLYLSGIMEYTGCASASAGRSSFTKESHETGLRHLRRRTGGRPSGYALLHLDGIGQRSGLLRHSLYQDLVIGGLSMWWIGTAAFGVLACLALLGAVPAGHFLAGLTLLGDIFLLLLMALTSPCVSCLVVACFFALTYWLFRRALHRDDRRPQERSLLLCAWLVLFVVNAGQVVRMQGEVWSISENSDQATVRMFFSPSCSACREGIGILSGSVDVAFCPVAENDADVARVERMLLLLEEGKTLKEAVAACQNVEEYP